MFPSTKDVKLYPPTRRQAAGTVYSDWFDVCEQWVAFLVLEVTAQCAYTDETLDVVIEGKTPYGSPFVIAHFTQVGNKTASLPFTELLNVETIVGQIRAKVVTAGTAVDYTLSVSGYAQ